ncbi:MAG TPA: response regulator [Aggregatilineales bacterium]|nr:response regulator [Anaerolineales bacterium]HRE48023.1 response regulator [Aggregatilineales bacterium]
MTTWIVVEDEPDIYDVLLAMFDLWGIEGIAFVDGGEAVAWIDDVDRGTVTGELPELALLDIRVPDVPGPEVGARIRRSPRLGQIAVVLITAHRLNRDQEEEVKAVSQADALLYKPLPAMPELRKILDTIILKRKTPPAGAGLSVPTTNNTAAAATSKAPTAPTLGQPAAPPLESAADTAKDGTKAGTSSPTTSAAPSTPIKPEGGTPTPRSSS